MPCDLTWMLITLACFGTKGKKKKRELTDLVQVQVQEKVPVHIKGFSLRRYWMISVISFGYEPAMSILQFLPRALPLATFLCSQQAAGHSG